VFRPWIDKDVFRSSIRWTKLIWNISFKITKLNNLRKIYHLIVSIILLLSWERLDRSVSIEQVGIKTNSTDGSLEVDTFFEINNWLLFERRL